MERLSQECYDLILGSLLGDAWLSNKKNRKNCYLGICHSVKQEAYLFHKFSILKEVGAKTIVNKKYFKNGKYIHSKEFVTKSLDIFTRLRDIYYPQGKKKITQNILNRISNRALAYWVMDDGSLVWHKRKRASGNIYSTCEFYLAVNCFSINEIELVRDWFSTKYQIDAKIRYHSSSKSFYLIINRINYEKLITHIKDFIIKEMHYKIDMSKLGKSVETTSTPNY